MEDIRTLGKSLPESNLVWGLCKNWPAPILWVIPEVVNPSAGPVIQRLATVEARSLCVPRVPSGFTLNHIKDPYMT